LAAREKSGEVEVVWVKIDHMRDFAAYLRQLEAWCAQLSLPARLLIARDRGIHFLAYGRCVSIYGMLFVVLKSGLWIRIRISLICWIWIGIQEGKNDPQKIEKCKEFSRVADPDPHGSALI
jgi:hypothetical protein